jgi:ribosomal protein S16
MSDCSLFYQLTGEDKALMPQQLQSSDSDIHTTDGIADDTEPRDGEHEALLGSYYPQTAEGTLKQNISKPYFAKGCNISVEQLEALATEDNTVTAWEIELRKCRTKR